MSRPPIFASAPRVIAACVAVAALFGGAAADERAAGTASAADLPNILWLSSEDNGPHLGAYGDDFATTPFLDDLAARGMVYTTAWSNAPVCGPARSTIITGVYPPSLGSQHMRSRVPLPEHVRLFPAYLRDAGYYTTNNAKTDYNLAIAGDGPEMAAAWNESSNRAHWRNRPDGAPFFAVFNFGVSHESQIRRRPHQPVHDPTGVRVPAYHPDIPEVRQDWAQYYDKLTEMDAQAGERLLELVQDGVVDDTIVVYFGDHGIGLPRGKRSTMDSGLRVPMIVYVPERFRGLAPGDWQPGGANERLVSFVDLAPTMLSLAGVEPPDYMQGSSFLGSFAGESPQYLHGFRGRMDERYDLVRSVRDERYVYVRNYMPHRIAGQHVAYMFQTPTTVAWKALHDAGELPPEQAAFWEPRPAEELYDLQADPDEVDNLAGSAGHQRVLLRMREAQRRHALEIHDLGFLPEPEVYARSGSSGIGGPVEPRVTGPPGGPPSPPITPYQLARDGVLYNQIEILRMAEQATEPEFYAPADLLPGLTHTDSAVRYWAVVGFLVRGERAVRMAREVLLVLLDDPTPAVRIVTAEALGRHGTADDLEPAIETLLRSADLSRNPLYESVMALNAIDYLDERAAGARDRIEALPGERPGIPAALQNYVPRLLQRIEELPRRRPDVPRPLEIFVPQLIDKILADLRESR